MLMIKYLVQLEEPRINDIPEELERTYVFNIEPRDMTIALCSAVDSDPAYQDYNTWTELGEWVIDA